MTPELDAAYAACRAIARREAKNFYYAFLALPRLKRDAICAVYAFMRHADDLSDNEGLSREQRRRALDSWLENWHGALAREPSQDPVLIALADAQRRFAIAPQLLDLLVEGTAADLKPAPEQPGAGSLATYSTFADLYRYCYLVASVVGLVCIRIFGYSDPSAEKLAEETGVAFQLTNILRDIKEDAARGRLYLPLEDLEASGVTPEQMVSIVSREQLTPKERQVLRIQAQRANGFYNAAHKLLPLISADSRPALWVLVTIYSRLLKRIERRNFDVFSKRITVPVYEKLTILGRGMLTTVFNRLHV